MSLVRTDVSEERIFLNLLVERITELGTTLAVTNNFSVHVNVENLYHDVDRMRKILGFHRGVYEECSGKLRLVGIVRTDVRRYVPPSSGWKESTS
jgi:hypothetical protein